MCPPANIFELFCNETLPPSPIHNETSSEEDTSSSEEESEEDTTFSYVFPPERIITFDNRPFYPMPENLRNLNPHWRLLDTGGMTILLNNVYYDRAPHSDQMLRILEPGEAPRGFSLDINFSATGEAHNYTLARSNADVIHHPSIFWLTLPYYPMIPIFYERTA